MTDKTFFQRLSHSDVDVVQRLLDLLEARGLAYCVIGGLAVNAYAEPVVSLDLDLVVVAEGIEGLVAAAEQAGFRVRTFAHSVNLDLAGSDLRIQLQTDPRYQAFLGRADVREVLGYALRVASVEDVLQGKLWAWQDTRRRPSKRQKDLSDLLRLAEALPQLRDRLPEPVRQLL